jgi:O-antigen/teichoic acid export membrane protein
VLARTGGIVFGVILVFHGHKVNGYLFGVASASCVIGLFGLLAAWPRASGRAAGGPGLRDWTRYGTPVAISGLGVWALLLVDRYLLAGLKSTGAVGIYALGAAIGSKAISIPALAFYTAARPLLITAFERHGRGEVERLIRAYSRIMLLLGLPCVALAAAVGSTVVPLLSKGYYEKYYHPAGAVIPIIAAAALIDSLSRIGNSGLTLAKRTRPLIYASFIGLAVNVAANLILIPPFGIKGAAISAPIGSLGLLLAAQYFARGHARWDFPLSTFVRAAAASLAGYAVARLAMELSDVRTAKLGLAALAGGVGYLIVLAALGERRAGRTEPSMSLGG